MNNVCGFGPLIMKVKAEISGETLDVWLEQDGDQIVAEVDGRRYELEVNEPEDGVYLFKSNGRVTEMFVTPSGVFGDRFQVQASGVDFEIGLIDPKRLRGSAQNAEHGGGAAEIRTAMPGKVVRLLIEPGAEIEKGDGVVVVEAMKMQNELKAPKAGKIKEIRVGEGETVGAGDVLVVIE